MSTAADAPKANRIPLKLFVLGERSGNPNDWSPWASRTLVLARSEEEARGLDDGYAGQVAEVHSDEPAVLYYERARGSSF